LLESTSFNPAFHHIILSIKRKNSYSYALPSKQF
jgi:hypothetical protein